MQNHHSQAQFSGFTHTSPCLAAVFDFKPPIHLAMLKKPSGCTGYRKVNKKLNMKEGRNVKLWLLQSILAARFVQGHWSTTKCFAAARWVFWWGAWGQTGGAGCTVGRLPGNRTLLGMILKSAPCHASSSVSGLLLKERSHLSPYCSSYNSSVPSTAPNQVIT